MRGRTKHKKGTNLDYVLSKKNLIYKWIMQGLTISDVAEKLGVSRSWLFDAFKSCAELNEVKESAFDDRRERVNNTLYKLALGTYTSRVKHTNKTTHTEKVGDKDEVSVTETTRKEDVFEHVDDPNLKAMALIVKQMELQGGLSKAENTIEDTLELPEDYVYTDVEDNS